MAVPFKLGTLALVATYGEKKRVDVHNEEVDETSNSANRIYEESLLSLQEAQQKSNDIFDSLGKLQMNIVETTFKQYEKLISRLDIDWESDELDPTLKNYNADSLHKVCNNIVTLSNATLELSGGAIVGFGAYGAAGLSNTASVDFAALSLLTAGFFGKSILKGVATRNTLNTLGILDTLEWFGGGAIITGGFEIRDDMVKLSSIVTMPIIATFGEFINAEKKLKNADEYFNAIKQICYEMKCEKYKWHLVEKNAKEKHSNLEKMNGELESIINAINEIADDVGIRVSKWDEDTQIKLIEAIQLIQTMVEAIKAPIMNDNDDATKEIIRLQKETIEQMEKVRKNFDNNNKADD